MREDVTHTPCPYSGSQLRDVIRDYFEFKGEQVSARILSERTGLSYDAVQKYVSGRSIPPPEKWSRLCEVILPGHTPEAYVLFKESMTVESVEPQSTPLPNHDSNETKSYENPPLVSPSLTKIDDKPSEVPSRPEQRQEFYLPVHGFVWFFPEEVKVINHPAFQRLRLVNQLGMAHLVFAGATHKRFEHVLGTVWVAHQMVESTNHNCRKDDWTEEPEANDYVLGKELSKNEHRFIRLAALLHDIGHVPFGHSIEDELQLLDYRSSAGFKENRHDGEERLEKVFNLEQWFGSSSESLSDLINREFNKYVPDQLRKAGFDATHVVKVLILKETPLSILDKMGGGPSDRERRLKELWASSEMRISICRDIVANTICADLLDYLHRDWYHVGKQRHFDQRIFHYMEIRTPKKNAPLGEGKPSTTADDHFVISIGSKPKLRTDGVSAILDLLESRYQLAETVLFHKTKLKATGMLERALSLAMARPPVGLSVGSVAGEEKPTRLEDWLLSNSEDSLLPGIVKGDVALVGTPSSEDAKARLKSAKGIAGKLIARDLYESIVVVTHDELLNFNGGKTKRFLADGLDAPGNRESTLRRLEADFDLPLGSLAMYCPESKMNRKIAEVKLYYEGTVMPFRLIDTEGELASEDLRVWGAKPTPALSGGHLKAQLHRFERLWRIGFYIDSSLRSNPQYDWEDLKAKLKKAFQVLVLRMINPGDTVVAEARNLAKALTESRWSHLYGRELLENASAEAPARQDPGSSEGNYITGSPSLLRFIKP